MRIKNMALTCCSFRRILKVKFFCLLFFSFVAYTVIIRIWNEDEWSDFEIWPSVYESNLQKWSPKLSIWSKLSLYWSRQKYSYCYKEGNNTIIFIHLTAKTDTWSPVEMCAFKSAAVKNPDAAVCVLTTIKMRPHDKLRNVTNLEFALLDIKNIFENTALEQWFNTFNENEGLQSDIFMWEVSDALRYAYLYKYGGKYMDSDCWTLKSLAPLQNAIIRENDEYLANGVMFFVKGHPFIEAVVNNFNTLLEPGKWASSGPLLVTAVRNRNLTDNTKYTELAPKLFLPIYVDKVRAPFQAEHKKLVEDAIKDSYAIHFWRHRPEFHEMLDGKHSLNGSFYDEFLNTVCA